MFTIVCGIKSNLAWLYSKIIAGWNINPVHDHIRTNGEPSTSLWLSIACVHWLNRSQGRCTLQNLFVMFSQAVLNRSYKVVLIIAAVVGPWTPCGFLEGRPFYFLKRALCTKRLPAPVPNTSSEARSPLCPSFPYTSSRNWQKPRLSTMRDGSTIETDNN